MHCPTLFRRPSYLVAIALAGCTSMASVAHAAEQPTLSNRLAQLRQSWSDDDRKPDAQVQQMAHTEPAKRSMAGDLFNLLGSKPKAEVTPRLASRPMDTPSAPPRQRAGSALSGPTSKSRYDLFHALGGSTERTSQAPTVAAAGPEPTLAPVKVAAKPAGVARRRPSTDLAHDLIGTTASSDDTRGVTHELDTGVPSAVGKVCQKPDDIAGSNDGGFATAADAAAAAVADFGAAPLTLDESTNDTTQQASPAESELAVEESMAPATEEIEPATGDYATSDWSTTPAAQVKQSDLLEPDFSTNAQSSPKAQRAFGAATQSNNQSPNNQSQVADDSRNAREVWISSPTTQTGSTTVGTADNDILVTGQLPQIVSRVSGPKTILIGREAKYQIILENRGAASAEQLSTEIVAPEWADVVHVTTSAGTVQRPISQNSGTTVRWDVASLTANGRQTLDMVVVPKTSQPLSLGVSWRHAPVAATTMVEVQEPKLAMSINGPDEVYFGRPQTYRLSVSNPGTGPAENIVIQMMPPGSNQPVSSYRIDKLTGGESKSVDIEITARDPGELAIKAVAAADGDLRSETSQQIFCRQAELNVDWRGPERKFAGTEATYFFRVRNPGTASADQVAFDVMLPAGFEFLGASDGHQFDRAGQRVTWKIGALRPGDDRYLELRGIVNQAGRNELRMAAQNAAGDVRDTKSASTEVVALADLKLDVSDPKGPVPVGSVVEYDIIVTNRGRSTAEEVNVVGLFSAGIEPVGAEGAEATIADGRVGFHTIGALPAGQQVKLKIRARAQSAGTHLFRAEVVCRDLEIKLAAEETTRFFQDESTASTDGTTIRPASRQSRFE